MSPTHSQILAEISSNLKNGSSRVYYASSDEDMFYLVEHVGHGLTATPICDERHEILLDLKATGQVVEKKPITISCKDGFAFELRTLGSAGV